MTPVFSAFQYKKLNFVLILNQKKINLISKEEKTAISIGHAVVLKDNCIGCGTCERHCPSEAIQMVDGKPAVNESRCLGCGACEYYCPARPMTAIYVEGREIHAEI